MQNSRRSARAPNSLSELSSKGSSSGSKASLGRFAPTPSGDMHFGSLVAATASCADALNRGGEHWVRIDDIDPPRIVQGSAERIVHALERFGVTISGDIVFQSTRQNAYQDALQQLAELDVLFACACSRQSLFQGHSCQAGCKKNRIPPNVPLRQQLEQLKNHAAIRLDTTHPRVKQCAPLSVTDRIQPVQNFPDLAVLGTPVLWRKDGLVSYLLATSIDDSNGVTDVVRGADLLAGSSAQQLIMELLMRPVPSWAHFPCAVDEHQQKLGKQTSAASIHDAPPLPLLQKAWQFLGQTPIACVTLTEFWNEAADSWAISNVPKEQTLKIT